MTVTPGTLPGLRPVLPLAVLALPGAVLGALAAGVGLDAAGWLAGGAVGVGTGRLLTRGLRRHRMRGLGPANRVTLARSGLVAGVAGLVADDRAGDLARTGVLALVVLGAVALLLDGVDGRVARRTGTASALGARFDMEVDAVLLLVLSVYVAGRLGAWVLAIGLMRYAFLAAMRPWPWLAGALPPRRSRKVVAAIQGVALVTAAAAVLPTPAAQALVGTALALLTWSFGRDIRWLYVGAAAVARVP